VNEDLDSDTYLTVATSFDNMGLNDKLLRGIYGYGYERPSSIQQKAILPIINQRDVIAQAQSGTGKTATFSIASLQIIDVDIHACQVLTLSPTRELAQQSSLVCRSLGDYLQANIYNCIGGTLISQDRQALNSGQHIIFGTPGRVYDLIKRNYLRLNKLKLLIIDEADEMLNRGFRDQIYDIFQHLPSDVQVCLFSATLPSDIMDMTNKFMRNPIRILIKKEEITLEGIKQYYVEVNENQKFETLCDLYSSLSINQAIIFVNSRRKVNWLHDMLSERDFTCSSIHGDLTHAERELVLKEFRSASSRVLIATDILARGIDIHGVSVVFNYDMPLQKEGYIHRIGRCGRFGRKGKAINFVSEKGRGGERGGRSESDLIMLEEIEKFYQTHITPLTEEALKEPAA